MPTHLACHRLPGFLYEGFWLRVLAVGFLVHVLLVVRFLGWFARLYLFEFEAVTYSIAFC